ncbi:hypothetical protein [Scytonema sp. UIC 10036]|uniref:hypothetical protein n=1 Tax=Scytonema sp. UIC 10036 TaxID=2304196 RepID=UPI0012DA2C7C|nr:hypothetical protein [Scytonema sp. UIC 10036]
MTLLWFVTYYQRTQQALRWWSFRQSMKLFLEAEKIRDDLLQESFTIRRSLELLPEDNVEFSLTTTQECLKKIDSFHQSLAQLSDRLFSAYLPEGLPLAIEFLLQSWLASNSHLYFRLDVPTYWQDEPAERSLVILTTLEELLRIVLPEVSTQMISVYVGLNQQESNRQLTVEITYPDLPTFFMFSSIPEIKYLCNTFKILTSGKCFCRNNNLSIIWSFCWYG